MKELLQIPAIMTKLETMRNKTIRFRVETNEIENPEDKTKIFNMLDTFGWFMFTQIEMDGDIEIPKYEKMEEDDKKTPSQRLRDVMYILWKQDEDTLRKQYKIFDNYYREKMDLIVEHFKKKIMDF